MRKLIAYKTKNTATLQALIARRIYAAGALGKGDIPADPKKPFMVFRELDTMAHNVAKDTAPTVCRKTFQFYIHDEKGGYNRIDRIMAILRDTVRGLEGQQSSTGSRCLGTTWVGDSGDSEDPTYDSALKIATFTLDSTG